MAETSARGKVSRAEPSKAMRAASRRAAESKATIPHLYMSAELNLGGSQALFGGADGGTEPIDVIVRAGALALREVPLLNGAYRDGAAETYERVNIGVSITGPEGPLTPTLFDADTKSLAELTSERRELERRAGEGALTAAELAGGTFTISGSGPRVRSYAPVIQSGQAGNIGIGDALERVVPSAGEQVIASIVIATLVADARMVDARSAALFLVALARLAGELPA